MDFPLFKSNGNGVSRKPNCETSAHVIFPAGDADVAIYVNDTCVIQCVLSEALGERLLLLCSDIIIMRCELNVM